MTHNSKHKNDRFLVHDDLTLILDKRFEDCEMSKCKNVLAINICLENSNPRIEFKNVLLTVRLVLVHFIEIL